jgi:hypothetical protein
MNFLARHKILIGILFFEGLAVIFAWSYVVPGTLERVIESKVEKACAPCELKIGSLGLNLFSPGDFTFKNVRFSIGEKDVLEVKASAKAIFFHISIHQLFNRRLWMRGLDIERPDVEVIDGDKKTAKKPDDVPAKILDFVLLPSKFHNGEFKYTRNHMGTAATVQVHEINGGITRLQPRMKELAQVHLRARYETTGRAILNVQMNPFLSPPKIIVQLNVENQDLQDLSRFLKPNAGVDLKGVMLKAQAVIDVENDVHERATVSVEYKDLKIDVQKEYDRTGLEAFFSTLGTDLSMNKENVGAPAEVQAKQLYLEREDKEDKSGKESIIHFILRGMKEGAMKVASANHLKSKMKQ